MDITIIGKVIDILATKEGQSGDREWVLTNILVEDKNGVRYNVPLMNKSVSVGDNVCIPCSYEAKELPHTWINILKPHEVFVLSQEEKTRYKDSKKRKENNNTDINYGRVDVNLLPF